MSSAFDERPGAGRVAQAGADLPAPPVPKISQIALFADLDGTLAPIELTPQAVGPDPSRRRLLETLSRALDGRLAIVTGRSLADVDRVLEGQVPAIAAVHGLVRRSASGKVTRAPASPALREARRALAGFAARDQRLMFEDKDLAGGLHFRRAPDAAAACAAFVRDLARQTGLEIQEGDMVVEVRLPGPDKGEAVRAFMGEPPFASHRPLFIGDDLTDEAGFVAAAELGGFGVVVGPRRPTAARYALADIAAVRSWLARLLNGDGSAS